MDSLYIIVALICFAAIDFGIVKLITWNQRRKAIKHSFANRKPTVIY